MICSLTYQYPLNPINQDAYFVIFANSKDFVIFST